MFVPDFVAAKQQWAQVMLHLVVIWMYISLLPVFDGDQTPVPVQDFSLDFVVDLAVDVVEHREPLVGPGLLFAGIRQKQPFGALDDLASAHAQRVVECDGGHCLDSACFRIADRPDLHFGNGQVVFLECGLLRHLFAFQAAAQREPTTCVGLVVGAALALSLAA